MVKKLEIIGAQAIWPTPNETTDQPFDKITTNHLVNKFSDFQVVHNFRPVMEKIGPYLQKIAQAPGYQRSAAIEVAKEDANFGANISNEDKLSLDDRIKKAQKISGPKLTMKK